MRIRLLPLAAALLFAAACDNPYTTPRETPPTVGPETRSRELQPGDSVVTESIDAPTDVDEYSMLVPRGRLHLTLRAGPGRVLAVAVVDSASKLVLQRYVLTEDSARSVLGGQGRRVFIRVEAVAGQASEGPYRLVTRFVSSYPENGDSIIAIGREVRDSLHTGDDTDEFVFHGTEGQEISVQFGQQEPANALDYVLTLLGPRDVAGGDILEVRRASSFSQRVNRGVITRLPATGTYRVHVTPREVIPNVTGNGYWFLLHPVRRAPETAGPTLVHGVASAEAIEVPGDIDEFTFPAEAGEFFRILITKTAPSRLEQQIIDGLTGEIVDRYVPDSEPELFAEGTRRFEAPRAGPYVIRMLSHGESDWGPYAGPYALTLYRFDAGPEDGAPATIAPGDVVRGERIWPEGDVDTYELTGTAGQHVTVMGAYGFGARIDLIHAESGDTIARLLDSRPGTAVDTRSTPLVRLPATGRYLVRVWTTEIDPHPEQNGTGPYTFSVAPVSLLPEENPEAYVLGTVVEEALAPVRDEDNFTFTATAGERIELWGELVSTSRPGALRISVVTTPSESHPIGVFPGTSFHTSSFVAPYTGTYRVVAESAGSASAGEFSGRYRFRVRIIP